MMVVGLKSGKELIVEDDGYTLFDIEGIPTFNIYFAEKRQFRIPIENIEFWNEPQNEQYIDHIKDLASKPAPVAKAFHGVDVT